MDHSAFSPNCLTISLDSVYPSLEIDFSLSSFQVARILMTLHVFLLLLLPFLAQLCHLYWTHDQPSHSKAEAMRTTVQRLLKPRTPLDCPACRLSCTPSSAVRPAPTPVRPWCEVKSRRGAPKRGNTDGFACPTHQCPSFGITDAPIHALVGDGKHGHAERIQTVRGPACRPTFTARRHTPLYRLKTPSRAGSPWC